MIKKILLTGLMLGVSSVAFANPAPYVGAALGLVTNTTSNSPIILVPGSVVNQPANFRGIPFSVFAGYGGIVNQNFYLGGELGVTLGSASIDNDTGLKTSYGYNVSLLPGLMLSEHTMAFGRLGVVRSHFSDVNSTQTGAQFGLGLQTNVTQNIDLRGEYNYIAYSAFNNDVGRMSSTRADVFNLGLIYKFD